MCVMEEVKVVSMPRIGDLPKGAYERRVLKG